MPEAIIPGGAFPLPAEVGDCYCLVGYPATGMACLAFAYPEYGYATKRGKRERRPQQEEEAPKWCWCLEADDGDVYPCNSCEQFFEACPADAVVLIRRAHDGLDEYLRRRLPSIVQAQLRGRWSTTARRAPEPRGER